MQITANILAVLLLLPAIALAGNYYSTRLASQMTYFSAIAYESQSLIESWTCPMCKGISLLSAKVVANDSNSVYGYIGYSPQHESVIIAFRGSVDTANWILNLKTVRTSYDLCDGCTVHVGFNQGFNSVKAQVEQHINYLLSIYRHEKIMLTGHSLGGALAVMAAAHLQSLYGHVDQLYTMGQPRVGNDNFAAYMTAFIPNSFRIVNYADQVPHIPQSILGFKHQGFEIWYQRGMQSYTICPSESKECSNQLNVFQVTQADHKMLLYLELKVEDSYSFAEVYGRMRFWWVSITTKGGVYNLDIETMQEEDRQIKAYLEQESRVKIISQ